MEFLNYPIKHLCIKSYNFHITELGQSHILFLSRTLITLTQMANNCYQNKLLIWLSKNWGGFVPNFVVHTEIFTKFTPSLHDKWVVVVVTFKSSNRSRTTLSVNQNTKSNGDSLTDAFPHFASAICICLQFWLVHWTVCLLAIDWSSVGFSRHPLKSALKGDSF